MGEVATAVEAMATAAAVLMVIAIVAAALVVIHLPGDVDGGGRE